MKSHLLIAALPAALSMSIACPGCGGARGLYPASGKVTYRGEPAVGATVFFHRIEGPAPDRVPTGVVGEDGGFRLSSDVADGAPSGSYNVLIAWQDRSAAAGRTPGASRPDRGDGGRKAARTASKIRPSASLPADRLKGRYFDPDHPLLKAEIKPGTNRLAPFDLSD